MVEYVKHIYSGRIYQVMRDHGPDHPYLWSPWEFSIRYPTPRREQFFRPCQKPETMPTRYDIRIETEIAWEDRKLYGSQPIVVHPPKPTQRMRRKKEKAPTPKRSPKAPRSSGGLTVQDLAQEIGCTPGQARAALRKSGVEKPQGGWRWATPEEAEGAKNLIKKNLR